MESAELGNTGIRVSRLCFGTGTRGWRGRSDQTDLGLEGLADLLRYAFDRGITFWDLADQYGSHPHAARALGHLNRESLVLATKTCATTKSEAEKDIARYLRELRTEYLDIVLMHCMTSAQWPESQSEVMEVLNRKKEQGIIRAHGVSCHDFGAFEKILETPWVDVVLARINYAGINMDAPTDQVIPLIERMGREGIGVYGMKAIGRGDLNHDPGKAIRYVMGLPFIASISVGMCSPREVEDNIAFVGESPLHPA